MKIIYSIKAKRQLIFATQKIIVGIQTPIIKTFTIRLEDYTQNSLLCQYPIISNWITKFFNLRS